ARTSGCRAPTVSRTSVTSLYPFRSSPALLRDASCTAILPSTAFFSSAGNVSQAVNISAKYVLPPLGGTSSACSIPALGGTSMYVMSACHTASPSPRLPIGLPFSTTLEMTLISGNSLLNGSPYGFGPGGSSSPKYLLNARSCGSDRFCP